MGNRALAIGTGIAEGLNSAVTNLYNINIAKQKLNMEKETHAADLKIKKAQLDKFELLYGPEQVQAERDKLKAETQASTALFNLRNIQITREQQKNEQQAKSGSMALGILDKVLRGGKIPPGMRINSSGSFSVSNQKGGGLSALLNENNGGSFDDGSEMPGTVPAGSAPLGSVKKDESTDWWNQ